MSMFCEAGVFLSEPVTRLDAGIKEVLLSAVL